MLALTLACFGSWVLKCVFAEAARSNCVHVIMSEWFREVILMRLFSRITRIIALVLFTGCLSVVSHASSPDVIRFASGDSALKIPFELHNNQIYLQISVNGTSSVWFVLDTGASTMISRSVAQKLNLKLKEEGDFQSKESRTFKFASTRSVSFKLPGANLSLDEVLVVAFEDLVKCLGRSVDGILGLEFFSDSVIEIDYKNRLISVYDAKSYKYSGKGKPFSIEQLTNGFITVRADVTPSNRAPFAGRFVVDTGFALSLLVNTHIVERNNLLADGQREVFSVCGFGESKAIKGKVASLRLGDLKFDNVTTIFSQAKGGDIAAEDIDGLLGGEILSQFKVIFDYSRKRMILESYSQS